MAFIVGKWKMDHSATVNWEAYAAAIKLPAQMAEVFGSGKIEVVNETTQDGDTFTSATSYGQDHTDTVIFKLGEKFKSSSMGVDVENLFELEGDVVVGTHTFLGQTTTSRRYLKDGKMIVESDASGVKLKNVLISC